MPCSILAYLLLKTFDIVNCNALCKFDLANFMETYLTLLHILLLVVAYWQALKNAWPKQIPKKYKFTTITSKLIIDFNVIIIAFKLDLCLSHMQWSCSSNYIDQTKQLIFFAKACSIVFIAQKRVNIHMFGLLINSQNINDQSKNIMCSFKHSTIKICYKMTMCSHW
jgi:phage-related holin